MRMANFALAISGVTRNVVCMGMSVCMLMGMSLMIMSATACVTMRMGMTMFFMVMTAATCIAVRVSMFMFFMLMGMSAATLVAVCVGMLMFFMLMGMSATAFVAVCVSMFMFFMLVVITCALMGMSAATCVAVCVSICVLMGMFFMLMGMSAAASVTVRMLRHMSHRLMIMVLATMAAGAAFRMLAIIFYAINATINMLVSSYIVSTITDIFEIFLHYIYHLSA